MLPYNKFVVEVQKRMENEVFERDYREEAPPGQPLYSSFAQRAISAQKENYEFLLNACDVLARQMKGYVKGVVDYKHLDAVIRLTLPFFEVSAEQDFQLIREIRDRACTFCFEPAEDDCICLDILIDYFGTAQ